MPVLRRRHLQRREFTKFHELALLKGHIFLSCFNSEDDRRVAWEEYGNELLSAWIAEHPGSRPWAWWAYQAANRRKCLNQPHPFEDPARKALIETNCADMSSIQASAYRQQVNQLRFGRPSAYICPGDWTAEYESEADYLVRHHLLSKAERVALAEVNKEEFV